MSESLDPSAGKAFFPSPADQSPADPSASGELLWIALQYLTGRLDAEAAASFEKGIQTDELVQESLAKANRVLAELSMTCEQYHCLKSKPSNKSTEKLASIKASQE